MRRGLLCALLIVAACVGGCESEHQPNFDDSQLLLLPDVPAIVHERSGGALVARSMVDGGVLWRYQPAVEPSSYLDFSATHALVCPIVRTPAGDLLLRYNDELHVISPVDGQLRWKINVWRWATEELRCPAATLDSGVLLMRRNGLLVQKLGADGEPAWQYLLISLGAAVGPPRVAADSGEVLIQTTSHVVLLSPDGALNWAVRR